MKVFAVLALLSLAVVQPPGEDLPDGDDPLVVVLETEFRQVERVADIEPAVLGVTVRAFMERQGSLRVSPALADPWENWNSSCVPNAQLPGRRLVLAAGSPDLWVIVYLEGGIMVQRILEVIMKSEDGWLMYHRTGLSALPERGGIEDLKRLIRGGTPGSQAFAQIPLEDQDLEPRTYHTELINAEGRTVRKRLLAEPATKKDPRLTPAFLKPPPHAKPYHGFPVVKETCHQGYCYGAITDYLQADTEAGCTVGDGFVEAPDGTRAGLSWVVQEKRGYAVLEPADMTRWGVYLFGVTEPVSSVDDLKRTFRSMVPALRKLHDEAKNRGGRPGS